MKVVNNLKPATKTVRPTKLEVGQIGIVVEPCTESFRQFLGQTVIKHFDGLLSLNDAHSTWSAITSTWPDFSVELLPSGTEVTLTVE